MNEQEQPTNGEDAAELELVAYLDGELDAEAGREVERRLAEDADYRRRMQQLDAAWELLDRLPRATADESFTKSTVEMVAVAAEKDVRQAAKSNSRRRALGAVVAAAGIVAAATIGYVLVTTRAQRPNDQLLVDLPVIENIDLYTHAESVEFLQLLDEEQLFAEEVEVEDEEI